MAPWQVEAGAIATEARTPATFIHIYALISCWGKSESLLAHTLETSCNVGASSVTADSRACCALIEVPTLSTRGPQSVSLRASTMEASLSVLALSIALTRTGSSFKALILVDALMGALVVGVSSFTVAPETAQEVHAGAMLTDVWHHLALINLLQVASQWVYNLTRSPTTTKSSVFCTTLKYSIIPFLCNV